MHWCISRDKLARIIPVYKNGDRESITNYRSISILSTLSKVFESLLHPISSRHVHHALSESQHGFIGCRSTITNVANFMNFVTTSVDARRQVDAVYTDFSKVFDKVNYKLLVAKLPPFGIGGPLL